MCVRWKGTLIAHYIKFNIRQKTSIFSSSFRVLNFYRNRMFQCERENRKKTVRIWTKKWPSTRLLNEILKLRKELITFCVRRYFKKLYVMQSLTWKFLKELTTGKALGWNGVGVLGKECFWAFFLNISKTCGWRKGPCSCDILIKNKIAVYIQRQQVGLVHLMWMLALKVLKLKLIIV